LIHLSWLVQFFVPTVIAERGFPYLYQQMFYGEPIIVPKYNVSDHNGSNYGYNPYIRIYSKCKKHILPSKDFNFFHYIEGAIAIIAYRTS